MLVLPATYAIMENLGIRATDASEMAFFERSGV